VKTVLYLTLSANGLITRANETHQVPPEILQDFVQRIQRAGNVVVGRRTFELMIAQAAQGAVAGVELVVVTGSGMQAGGVATAASPQEALELLERKGFETALVGGGAELDASFLSHGLVDEICLNVESILSSDGLSLDFDTGHATDLRLIDTRKLSESVVQLRYEVRR
jgi:dihydrofolate reductase